MLYKSRPGEFANNEKKQVGVGVVHLFSRPMPKCTKCYRDDTHLADDSVPRSNNYRAQRSHKSSNKFHDFLGFWNYGIVVWILGFYSPGDGWSWGISSGKLWPRASSKYCRYDCRDNDVRRFESEHSLNAIAYEQNWKLTSIAMIFPFINWFSVAARSSLSRVNCIGLRELSISVRTCIGTIVCVCCAISSNVDKCPMTSFLTGLLQPQVSYQRRLRLTLEVQPVCLLLACLSL